MSRLKVMLRGSLISEIELNPEKEYIGGRKEGSDIRLQAEKGISREHFKLKYSEGHWQIKAVSRFGDIFSLGQKIEQTDLQHGQIFQIPPYEFTFLDVPDAGLPIQDQANPAVDFGEHEKTVIGAAPQVPYIKMVNSTGEVREMLRLEFGEVWVAGRDPSCQIIIPDQRVSRRQFEIYKVNGGYTILDLASVNGTFLNGSPVSSTDPQTLKSGDAISVLDNMMYFELHDPNFKYKVERIEVPPLQIDQAENEEVYEEVAGETEIMQGAEEIPQIEQYDVQQQLMTSESPFTGMPPGGEEQGPNQYYDFQQPPPLQKEIQVTGLKKLMQNKPALIIIVLVILGGAYYVSDMLSEPEVVQTAQVESGDPFSKLTPAQQKEIEEYYTLAEQMINMQKYDLALEKIRKIKEILPTGYKEIDKLEHNAEQGQFAVVQRQKDEEAQKAAEELFAKNKQILADCAKLLNPDITSTEMSSCLAPVIALPGEKPEISNDVTRLLAEAEKLEKAKEQKQKETRTYEEQLKEINKLFAEAEAVQAQGFAFKAIKKYKLVVSRSDLPDPNNLKNKASDRIEFIEQKIREKSQGSISSAETLYKAGNIKEAIITLREAKIYDPENKSIQEKIEIFSSELKRRVRTIYQEAIIDENYGVIENTETKLGAMEKWKKITEMDLEDGEYFRKAVTKLRRYGAM